MSIRLKAEDFVFLSQLFPEVGYMIENRMCLFVYLNYVCFYLLMSRGNLNIINQWGEPQKKGEPNFEISVGGSKAGDMIFDSNLVRGKILEENKFISLGNFRA